MPLAGTGSRASRGNPGSGKQISLAETRAANQVRQVSPASRDKATARHPEATAHQAHRMAVRTEDLLAVHAAVPGLAATARSIAGGTVAIPEAIGRRDTKRSRCRLRRKKFNALTRKPCAS